MLKRQLQYIQNMVGIAANSFVECYNDFHESNINKCREQWKTVNGSYNIGTRTHEQAGTWKLNKDIWNSLFWTFEMLDCIQRELSNNFISTASN